MYNVYEQYTTCANIEWWSVKYAFYKDSRQMPQ